MQKTDEAIMLQNNEFEKILIEISTMKYNIVLALHASRFTSLTQSLQWNPIISIIYFLNVPMYGNTILKQQNLKNHF